MTPVLQRWSFECPLWPVVEPELFLPVPHRPTREHVGALAWALIGPRVTADDLSITVTRAADAVEAYADGDDDFASGGIRLQAGDVVVDPGCCTGLSEWRDWLRVADGEDIDLGHDPYVRMEHHGPTVRVWTDASTPAPARTGGPPAALVEFPVTDLTHLLHSVRQDLIDFLAALHEWARHVVPSHADLLTAVVDRRLTARAPLDHPVP